MNNKILIAIGAVVIIGALIWFMMMRTPQNNSLGGISPSGMQKMSMKSLLASGKSQTCTFTNNSDGDLQSSGTVQIADGKMRGDFSVTTPGGTKQTHMITMDNTNYVWGDGLQGGIKMMMTDFEKPENQNQNQAIDYNREVDYSCSSGVSDTNAFVLPAGIEFKDMSAMMQGMIPGGVKTTTGTKDNPDYSPVKEAQCGACNNYPEPQKTQCRQALQCK